MVAVTAGLMAASLFWRRGRFLAGIALVAVVAIRLPSFALLLVPAYPTSFYTSPTGFAASTIVQGQALFTANCVSCHGAGGQGDGPGAADARVRPADLTAPHLLEHPDGELFWWLTHGMEDPEGGLAMPGFAGVLTDAERWALIDFIRARNLGVALRRTGAWPQPTPAPSLPITCANPAIAEMAELRGKVVAVVANGPGIPTPRADGVTVLNLVPGQGHAACTAETEDAWQAYAILTGVPPRDLAGSVILVDPDGWLRAVRHGDIAPNWNDPDLLRAEVRQIREHPISTPSGGSHDHHH
jgi:mono/diheme cytochrome c family protein